MPGLISDLVDNDIEVIEVVSCAELVKSWKSDFGIDVARLFQGVEQLHMVRNRKTGIVQFDPPILGDARFYKDLRSFKWYHPDAKEEFNAAAADYVPGQQVIDVGAGHGDFAGHVKGQDYLGLETDPEAVADCVARGLNVLPMTMAEHLSRGDSKRADLTTAFQVLEHVAEPDVFLGQMVDLTKPGGCVVIGVPDADSYVSDLPDFMLNAPPHHITWWTEDALVGLMAEKGLAILDVRRFKLEPWERQLWWMAKFARLLSRSNVSKFGSPHRMRKVASFVLSFGAQILPLPQSATGSTLLAIAAKPSL
ncbi:MAG: class I SAM-dependent methyltransferase [Pseudomonadota bacterium]